MTEPKCVPSSISGVCERGASVIISMAVVEALRAAVRAPERSLFMLAPATNEANSWAQPGWPHWPHHGLRAGSDRLAVCILFFDFQSVHLIR